MTNAELKTTSTNAKNHTQFLTKMSFKNVSQHGKNVKFKTIFHSKIFLEFLNEREI